MRVEEKMAQVITDMIEKEGILPWHKPWTPGSFEHVNMLTGNPYRGFNILWLTIGASIEGYTSNGWATLNQFNKMGYKVLSGQHGHLLGYYDRKTCAAEVNEDGEVGREKSYLFMKQFYVFNVAQTNMPQSEWPSQKLTDHGDHPAENFYYNMPTPPQVNISPLNKGACYYPSLDVVNMPAKGQFDSLPAFVSTLMHEMVHATGHESRLDRWKGDATKHQFGSEDYSKEELVAEIGACILRSEYGIDFEDERKNSASYLKGWLKRLKDHPREIVHACSAAVKAANLIMGKEA